MVNLNIGQKIQRYRNQRGLSLRGLAEKTGITASMISQIENNSVNPSINTLKTLAETLDFPLYVLFQEDSDPEQELIVRKGEYRSIGNRNSEVAYNLLTADTKASIEFVLMEIPPQTAGLLLAAILSDTLVFRSPTCTPVDVNAANRLAGIAGVDIDEFANEMFEAGEKLDGKTAEEVFLQDFKVFMCGDIRFGVAQGSYMTRKNLTAAEALLKPYLEEARNKQNVEDIYMLLTDVPKEESVVICNGRYAAEMASTPSPPPMPAGRCRAW